MKKIFIVCLALILLVGCQAKQPVETPESLTEVPVETLVSEPVVPETVELETVEPETLESVVISPETVKPVVETPEAIVESIPEPEPELEPVDMYGSSLERDYDWYIDQATTGDHAYDNCGPTSTVMAIKWYNPDLAATVPEARSKYRPEGGWWYTTDIEAYLNEYGVPVQYQDFESSQDIVNAIDRGQLVIICLDTSHLSFVTSDTNRIGKYYDGGFGHFIVGKGYRYINDRLYIEVYDPWSLGATYADGTLKGMDRLYPADELDPAISQWWDYLMIIG